MDDILELKNEIRQEVSKKQALLSKKELTEKTQLVANRLFEFANFMESSIALLYMSKPTEISTDDIIKQCYHFNKIVVLPSFNVEKRTMKLLKVDNPDVEGIAGERDCAVGAQAARYIKHANRVARQDMPLSALIEPLAPVPSGYAHLLRLPVVCAGKPRQVQVYDQGEG